MYIFCWLNKKNITINPISKKDNKCFQYAVTVPLNFEEIKKISVKNRKNQTFHKQI